MTILNEDSFEMEADDGLAEVTSHMKDAIHHGEPLDLTFIDGEEYVELDVHTMQYILNKGMVGQMIDSADSPDTFQLFLNTLFFNSEESSTSVLDNELEGNQ